MLRSRAPMRRLVGILLLAALHAALLTPTALAQAGAAAAAPVTAAAAGQPPPPPGPMDLLPPPPGPMPPGPMGPPPPPPGPMLPPPPPPGPMPPPMPPPPPPGGSMIRPPGRLAPVIPPLPTPGPALPKAAEGQAVKRTAPPPAPQRLASDLPFSVWSDAQGTLFGPFSVMDVSATVAPDGRHVWLSGTGPEPERQRLVAIVRPDGTGATVQSETSLHLLAWHPSGQVLAISYPRPGEETYSLYLVALDGSTRRVYAGTERPGVFKSFSNDGAMALFFTNQAVRGLDLTTGLVATVLSTFPDGTPINADPWRSLPVALSPDGTEVAAAQAGKILLYALDTREWRAIETPDRWLSGPDWSPSGDRLAFVSAPVVGGEPALPNNYSGGKDAAGDTLHIATRSGTELVKLHLARPGRYVNGVKWFGEQMVRVGEMQYYPYGPDRFGAQGTGRLAVDLTGAAPRAFELRHLGHEVYEEPLVFPGGNQLLLSLPTPDYRRAAHRFDLQQRTLTPVQEWAWELIRQHDAREPLVYLKGPLARWYGLGTDGDLVPLSEWMRPATISGARGFASIGGGLLAYTVPGVEGMYVRVRPATALPDEPLPSREAVLGPVPGAEIAGWPGADTPPRPLLDLAPVVPGTGGRLQAATAAQEYPDWVYLDGDTVNLVFRPDAPVTSVELHGAAMGGQEASMKYMQPHSLGTATAEPDGTWTFTFTRPSPFDWRLWANARTAAGDWVQSSVLYLRQIPEQNFRPVVSAHTAVLPTTAAADLSRWMGDYRFFVLNRPSELAPLLPYVAAVGGPGAVAALSPPFINWQREQVIMVFRSGADAPVAFREVGEGWSFLAREPDQEPGAPEGFALAAVAQPRRQSRYQSNDMADWHTLSTGPHVWRQRPVAKTLAWRDPPVDLARLAPAAHPGEVFTAYLQARERGDRTAAAAFFTRQAQADGYFPEWLAPLPGPATVTGWNGGWSAHRFENDVTVRVQTRGASPLPWRSGSQSMRVQMVNEGGQWRIGFLEMKGY